MPFGYCGKTARIDLTTRTVRAEEHDEVFYRTYIGGKNFVARTLLTEIPAGADPLGPDNVIAISTSVLTGTPIPGSSRFSVGAKSPLTLGYGDSEAGGWWGPELKRAGFDSLVITGRSTSPIYLWIDDGKVEFRDASDMVGCDTGTVYDLIKQETGVNRARILQSGPAGERQVRYAALNNELRHWCGRTGMGAVFGSKNLRAIAVAGSRSVETARPEIIRDFARWFSKHVDAHPGLKVNKALGTPKNAIPLSEMGLCPTSNFRKGSFDGAAKVGGEALVETKLLKRGESCFACPVKCKRVVGLESHDIEIDERYGGPEWESIGSLGTNCEIDDPAIICKANELCNRYGLDTISTGVTIAFAMECYEKGLLTEKDTDGVDLSFGNGRAVLEMVRKIGEREGFGDLLAEGSYRAAKKIGQGAEQYSMTSKMQEFPAHEPRGKWGVALGYAISATGADHLVAAHDSWFELEPHPEERLSFIDVSDLSIFGPTDPIPATSLGPEKIKLFSHLELLWSLNNVLDLCIFVCSPEYRMITTAQIIQLIGDVTGWDFSVYEAMAASERSINMARMFNVKHGKTKADDALPDRIFEPLENGAYKGTAVDRDAFEKAKVAYYQAHGWTDDGVPTYGLLARLGLADLHQEISTGQL